MRNKKIKLKKSKYPQIILFFLSILVILLNKSSICYENGFGFLASFNYLFILFFNKNLSYKKSLLFGFIFGLIIFSLQCFWLFNYNLWILITYSIIWGIIQSVLFLVLNYINKKHLKWGWLFQWFVVCSYEVCLVYIIPEFNLFISAYSYWRYTKVIRFAEIIGVYGFSFIIIFPSFLFYAIIGKIIDKKNIKINRDTDNTLYECNSHINYISKYEIQLKSTSLVFPVIFLILWCGAFYGVIRYGPINKESDNHNEFKNLVLIQNPVKISTDFSQIDKTLDLMDFTDIVFEMDETVDMIIWPEKSISCFFDDKKNDNSTENKLKLSLESYINAHDCDFLIGNYFTNENNEWFNTAQFFDKKNNLRIDYVKNCPEIYKEVFPVISLIPSVKSTLSENGFYSYNKGSDFKIIKKDKLNFSVILGNEVFLSDYCRRQIKAGSNCIINLNSDYKYFSKIAFNQFLSVNVFRAVENHIPIVFCSDGGFSGVIDENGKILDCTEAFSKTYINLNVPVIYDNKDTFYNRYGNLINISFLILGIGLLLIQIFIDIIKSINKKFKENKNG